MRNFKVTIYILAALATCELSHKANATSSFNLSTKEPGVSNLTALNNTDQRRRGDGETRRRGELPVSVDRSEASLLESPPIFHGVSPRLPIPASSRLLQAQATTFTDIQGNWAQSFIQALAARGIIQGFPDGSFRPDAPVTRAQFAAMIGKAFQKNPTREAIAFVDVPAYYWASEAIREAYEIGFLEGYPGNVFNPNQNIPRVQALVSLVNGLNLSATGTTPTVLDTYFQDASQIPNYARDSVAAATEKRIVVNYPNVAYLNPNQVATRADVAAFIYQALVSTGEVPPLEPAAIASQYVVGPVPTTSTPPPTTPTATPPSSAEIQKLQSQLRALQETNDFGNIFQASPGITIATLSGFGADQNTLFIGATYQERTREGDEDDGAIGFGVGLGDSRRLVGVELSYTLGSVTSDYTAFGEGGFNAKVHRQFPGDFALAVGYNGFLEIGEDNDFEDSLYGVVTKVFRTRENVNSPLSRVAVTAGLGDGQFRSESDIDDDEDSVNVFGSVAVRVAQPVSLIGEWTGQDLAFGVSIVPIKNLSWAITPAVRDVAGAGDEPRFVLGTGFSFRF